MPLELQPLNTADTLRAAHIGDAAYAANPHNRILFPGPFPPNVFELRAEELAAELAADVEGKWLKIVDTELTGDEAMIAWGRWGFYPERVPADANNGTGEDSGERNVAPWMNGDACTAVFGGVAKTRDRILNGKGHAC
jgi:hypothetical protein